MTNQEAGRQEALQRILDSTASRKLIVAGPGTGKSFTFRKLLERGAGPHLALTFINALAADLEQTLGELAETYTFHGYCRRLLHTTSTGGITTGVSYYPPLIILQAKDLTYLRTGVVTNRNIEHDFHYLDQSTSVIEDSLRSGNYYDAVGHIDSVYRVLQHFEQHSDAVPQYAQIVVDEYQDFSLLEARFIAALAQRNPTLVVGDDDQSLYGFKHASADYIRDLATDAEYERFELPYCTRCPQVLVAATHTVVERAQAMGLLSNRLEKPYECYLPDKRADSERCPKITYAQCTVERNNAPYMAKYIHQRILEIPAEEIAGSREAGDPTVLVTGPTQFAGRIFDYLARYFEDVTFKKSSQPEIEAVEGYRRLAANEKSRLGWRILLHVHPVAELAKVLRAALVDGSELCDELPTRYRDTHLSHARLLQRLRTGDALTANEILTLEAAVRMPYRDLRALLKLDGVEEEVPAEDVEANDQTPRIVVTSLVGAKGLQASHVFVVGVNESHFPRSNTAITDEEVCCLLVALTRAKKSCTLISCGRFGFQQLGRSAFVTWLRPHLDDQRVDASFFAQSR